MVLPNNNFELHPYATYSKEKRGTEVNRRMRRWSRHPQKAYFFYTEGYLHAVVEQ